MNDAVEILSVGFSVALIFSLPFAFVAFLRYMRYRERVALAERGVSPSEPAGTNGSGGMSSLLRWGIIFAAIGLALSCSAFTGLAFFTVMSNSSGPGIVLLVTPLMFLVLLPLFFGLALIVINRLNGRSAPNADREDTVPAQKG